MVGEINTTPRFAWNDTDVIALLSWLDVCKETDSSFDESVINHISNEHSKRTGEHHEFSMTQIMNKLKNLSRAHEKSFRMELVLKKGSKYFPDISEHIKEGIQHEVIRCKAMKMSKVPPIRKAAVAASKAFVESRDDTDAGSPATIKLTKEVSPRNMF